MPKLLFVSEQKMGFKIFLSFKIFFIFQLFFTAVKKREEIIIDRKERKADLHLVRDPLVADLWHSLVGYGDTDMNYKPVSVTFTVLQT